MRRSWACARGTLARPTLPIRQSRFSSQLSATEQRLRELRAAWVNDPAPLPFDDPEAAKRRAGGEGGLQLVTLATRPDLAKRFVAAEVGGFATFLSYAENSCIENWQLNIMENPHIQLMLIEPNPEYDPNSEGAIRVKELGLHQPPTTVDELTDAGEVCLQFYEDFGLTSNTSKYFPERLLTASVATACYWNGQFEDFPYSYDHAYETALTHQRVPFKAMDWLPKPKNKPLVPPAGKAAKEIPRFHGYAGQSNWDGINTMLGLSMALNPLLQGQGFAPFMVRAKHANAARWGLEKFIAFLRPVDMGKYPLMTPKQYSDWKIVDKNGEKRHRDPWARVHTRLGGQMMDGVTAMRFRGTIDEWSEWTKLSFPYSGKYIIPGGQQPLDIDLDSGIGLIDDPGIPLFYTSLVK